MNRFLHDDPRMPEAWAPWFSHEYITYYAVQAIDRVLSLPPVPVTANPLANDPLWPAGPGHIDLYKESFILVRHLDHLRSFNYEQRNGDYACDPPLGKSIEPWKILVIYTTEPDLQLDCGLALHKHQTVTGGSHGWRHMQLRIPGYTFGIAPQSFRYHLDAARRCFGCGNYYWGWRYLSRCTHYLADLGHPFHVKAAPTGYLIRNIWSFRDLFRTVSALHTGYEIYTERMFREGLPAFKDALVQGTGEGYAAGLDVDSCLDGYIRRAQGRLDPIFSFMLDRYGRELPDVYRTVDRTAQTDVASQTKSLSEKAAAVLFRGSTFPFLKDLNDATAVILKDVGRMLGMLLAGFPA